MSKSRAQARRREKKSQKSGIRESNRIGFWAIAVLVPALILLLLIYSQFPADDTNSTLLPSATQGEEVTTAIALTATANADSLLAATTAPPQWPVGSADYCRRHPRFARQLGFNERSFLTTSAPSVKGLALIQPADATTQEQFFQDPTWDDGGYLGHMSFDPIGNVYVFPSPRVSLVDNPPELQNILFRVDTDSAQMTAFITLTTDLPSSAENPFGIMGTTYDCDTQSLYVSTVAGSTASAEVGKIVRIDLATATIVAELQGIDPFGLSVFNAVNDSVRNDNGTASQSTVQPIAKRLYFGAARTAEVYSIALNEQGDFVGQPALELALPDGSLKPWRIVWDSNGDMIVRAMPFDYNLIATSERIEVPFRFRRDATGLWQWIQE